MMRPNLKITLPDALHAWLDEQVATRPPAELMPLGMRYKPSRYFGYLGEMNYHLWYRSPYVSPLSHHFSFVDAHGNVWMRALQLLKPCALRQRFPCLVAMKDEKKKYYRYRVSNGESYHPTSREHEEAVSNHWLVSQFAFWVISEEQFGKMTWRGEEKRKRAKDGKRHLVDPVDCVSNGHLLQRELLFQATRRRPDKVVENPDGITAKSADVEVNTDKPVIRETLVCIKDYAQRSGSALTDSPYDRLAFPVTVPSRNMAISVMIDSNFLGKASPDLEIEWRNQEMARFGEDGPEPQRKPTDSAVTGFPVYLPVTIDHAHEACPSFDAMKDRLSEIADTPAVTEEGRELISSLELPKMYACLRYVCPWPPAGNQLCARWKMPSEARAGFEMAPPSALRTHT